MAQRDWNIVFGMCIVQCAYVCVNCGVWTRCLQLHAPLSTLSKFSICKEKKSHLDTSPCCQLSRSSSPPLPPSRAFLLYTQVNTANWEFFMSRAHGSFDGSHLYASAVFHFHWDIYTHTSAVCHPTKKKNHTRSIHNIFARRTWRRYSHRRVSLHLDNFM